jgi:signal peptidase I
MDEQLKQQPPLAAPYWDIAPRPSGDSLRRRPAGWQILVSETLETVLLAAVIWLVVNLATARFVVDGSSMEPNFHTGQLLIVNRLAYRFGTVERGDVIVFRFPGNTADDYIKRVIGLPGETVAIRDGKVYIDGNLLEEPYLAPDTTLPYGGEWVVPADSYFVMGDNRPHSSDSRSWGMLGKEYVIGKSWISYWPPPYWGVVPHYSYGYSPQ